MISYHYYILCLWKCNKSKFKPWYFCTFCQIDMVFSSTSQAADLVYLTCHERQGLRPAKGASWRISGSFKCANVWRQVGTHILYVGLTKKDGTPSKGLLNRGNIYMNLFMYIHETIWTYRRAGNWWSNKHQNLEVHCFHLQSHMQTEVWTHRKLAGALQSISLALCWWAHLRHIFAIHTWVEVLIRTHLCIQPQQTSDPSFLHVLSVSSSKHTLW